jgi:hypothetical protein
MVFVPTLHRASLIATSKICSGGSGSNRWGGQCRLGLVRFADKGVLAGGGLHRHLSSYDKRHFSDGKILGIFLRHETRTLSTN